MLIRHKDRSQDKSRDKMKNKEANQSHSKSEEVSNARLKDIIPTNSEGTAAWQSSDSKDPEDQVSKPSIERVMDAKDWVDNGSRL